MGNGPGTKNKGEIRKIKSHYFLSFLSFHNQTCLISIILFLKNSFLSLELQQKTILRKKPVEVPTVLIWRYKCLFKKKIKNYI